MSGTHQLLLNISALRPLRATAEFADEAHRDAHRYTQSDVGKVVKVLSPLKWWLIVSVAHGTATFRELTADLVSVDASEVANDSTVAGATVQAALDELSAKVAAATSASGVANDSSVAGATVKDALDSLSGSVGGGAVSSVFGRSGAITAQSGDYSAAQVGAPPIARIITAGAGLSGGGDLSADRTLSADFGSSAGKVCQGDDPRLSDARAPLAHALTHAPGGPDGLPVGTAVAIGTANSAGTAASYARADHVHDGSALVPRDGSRPLTGALDAGGFNVTNVGAVFEPPTSFAWVANAATIDVSVKNDFVASDTLTGNSTITLSNGIDGCQGSIYVKQDATGGRGVAFVVPGRTILREAGAMDSNPQPGPNSVTGYSYDFKTIGGTAYVIVERFFLT